MSGKEYEFVGPDVDLDNEVALLPSGERLTSDRAEEIVEELTERRVGGRPSLSGQRVASPAVSFRLDPDTLARVQAVAQREDLSVSQVARLALEQYLTKVS